MNLSVLKSGLIALGSMLMILTHACSQEETVPPSSWQLHVLGGDNNIAKDVVQLPDSQGYIVTGQYFVHTDSLTWSSAVAHISANGELLNSRSTGHDGFNKKTRKFVDKSRLQYVTQLKDGRLILYGYRDSFLRVQEIDKSLNVLFDTVYNSILHHSLHPDKLIETARGLSYFNTAHDTFRQITISNDLKHVTFNLFPTIQDLQLHNSGVWLVQEDTFRNEVLIFTYGCLRSSMRSYKIANYDYRIKGDSVDHYFSACDTFGRYLIRFDMNHQQVKKVLSFPFGYLVNQIKPVQSGYEMVGDLDLFDEQKHHSDLLYFHMDTEGILSKERTWKVKKHTHGKGIVERMGNQVIIGDALDSMGFSLFELVANSESSTDVSMLPGESYNKVIPTRDGGYIAVGKSSRSSWWINKN